MAQAVYKLHRKHFLVPGNPAREWGRMFVLYIKKNSIILLTPEQHGVYEPLFFFDI